jgi:hypothetical protein
MRAMAFRRAAFGAALLLTSVLAGCDDDDRPVEHSASSAWA